MQLNARTGVLLALAITTLGILVICAGQAGSLLKSTLAKSAQDGAAEDAELISDFGLAAALVDGRLNQADARAARQEIAAVQRSHPLSGVIVWTQAGRRVFSVGGVSGLETRTPPEVVRAALARATTTTSYADPPGSEPQVVAAVPVAGVPGRMVAEFLFSRTAVEDDLAAAKLRLYVVMAVGALLFYLAIFPMLARLAKRLPPSLTRSQTTTLREFRRALKEHELSVHYQPKVAVETGALVGVEALVRWDHPSRGLLPPGVFLPEVEKRRELLTAMTVRVLDCALRDCGRWLRAGRRVPVAVNVGAAALLDEPLVEHVEGALVRHGVEPSLLTLEITESAVIESGPQAVTTLQEIRALGVAVSLDDFGTGYSSLSRLRNLPLDELKVDRSFIRDIATDQQDLVIARLIIDVGASLGLRVVAEGVEDERTLELLAYLGCPVAQGFLFATPMSEPDLRRWLDRREPDRRTRTDRGRVDFGVTRR